MYPQSNSARSVRDLSGVWDFRFNADEPWQPIAVPASYNDQSPDPEFRRHYGMAYYRTTFTVPEGARRVLRFDAVTHNAVVRLNGQEIASHRGGFLPFEADITALAQPGETVTLVVRPECIRLAEPGESVPEGKSLEGQIENYSFLGRMIRYWVRVGEEQFIIDDANVDLSGARSGAVQLCLDTRKLHILKDGGSHDT